MPSSFDVHQRCLLLFCLFWLAAGGCEHIDESEQPSGANYASIQDDGAKEIPRRLQRWVEVLHLRGLRGWKRPELVHP